MSESPSSAWTPHDVRKFFRDIKAVWQWLRALLTAKREPGDDPPPDGSPTEPSPASEILIIGPGGTGKSMFAKLIAGQLFPWASGEAWEYARSFGEEVYQLAGEVGVEIVVPAGQPHNRDAEWADVRPDIAAGRYRGVILTTSFGYHNFTGPGYQGHELYDGSLPRFQDAYTARMRQAELAVLDYLVPALRCATGRMWLLTLVTKQDLWSKDEDAVRAFYASEGWSGKLSPTPAGLGPKHFKHEVCPVSLTLTNLKDPEGTPIFKTTAGYDQEAQAKSLERLFRVFEALKTWGEHE